MKVICDFSVSSALHRPLGAALPWSAAWNSPLSDTAPGLVLDFAADIYGTDGSSGSLQSVLLHQRSSDGTRFDETGGLDIVGPDLSRIDHDPVSLGRLGLMLEAGRTNLFLQSAIPADQTISVAAVPHVLSFYGTGTITISGAHSATAVGAGGFPTRTELAFTPGAGNLNLVLSGDIFAPQLEEGETASSYIPTGAVATARGQDIATVDLGGWFSSSQGTLVFSGWLNGAAANDRIVEIDSGVSSTRFSILWNSSLGKPQFQVWEAGALQAAVAPAGNSIGFGTPFRVAICYAADDFAISLNGSDVAKDTAGILPSGLTTVRLGRSVWGAQGLMLAESIVYYPQRLADAELKALST